MPAASNQKKVTIAGKTQEIKLQRDLFGRILGISLDAKIDMAKVYHKICYVKLIYNEYVQAFLIIISRYCHTL